MIEEIPELKLPNLDFLQFGNIYSGGYGCGDFNFNFKIFPQVPNSKFKVFVWLGLNCLEKSESCGQEEFCLDEQGYESAQKWVLSEFKNLMDYD